MSLKNVQRTIAVAIALTVVPAAGLAQPNPDKPELKQAEELFKEGLRYYNVGEYDQAIAKFKESYVISSAPLLIFNIAQAYRLKGDCEQALRHYRTYLREEAKPGANKQKAEQAIELCTARQSAEAAQGGSKVEEPAPPPSPPADAAQGAGSASGSPTTTVVRGPVDDSAGRTTRIVGLSVGGGGLLLVAAGVYFGLKASSDANAIEDYDGVWDESWKDREARQKRNSVLAPTALGIGAAAVAGGVFLYLRGRRQAAAATDVSAIPLRGGAAVAIEHRF